MTGRLLNHVEIVLFDVVGTLLSPREPVAATYRRFAQQLGSSIPESDMAVRFAAVMANEDVPDASDKPDHGAPSERDRWRRIVRQVVPDLAETQSENLFQRLWDHYARPAAWTLFEDVPPVWRQLTQAGLQLGLASNFDNRLNAVRRGIPPLDEIGWCFVSDDIGFRKQDPRFYEAITARLGVQPERILLVGDHPISDFASPRSAGWQSVLIARQGLRAKNQVVSLQELPPMLAADPDSRIALGSSVETD